MERSWAPHFRQMPPPCHSLHHSLTLVLAHFYYLFIIIIITYCLPSSPFLHLLHRLYGQCDHVCLQLGHLLTFKLTVLSPGRKSHISVSSSLTSAHSQLTFLSTSSHLVSSSQAPDTSFCLGEGRAGENPEKGTAGFPVQCLGALIFIFFLKALLRI
jgi:hypothetical protein